jgi:acyl-coenzyme A thioesterase 9
MHIQDKNLHGKVFGGHIMREAAELGWVTSYMYGKGQSPPEFMHIDDVLFLSPVDLGKIAIFECKINFC